MMYIYSEDEPARVFSARRIRPNARAQTGSRDKSKNTVKLVSSENLLKHADNKSNTYSVHH